MTPKQTQQEKELHKKLDRIIELLEAIAAAEYGQHEQNTAFLEALLGKSKQTGLEAYQRQRLLGGEGARVR